MRSISGLVAALLLWGARASLSSARRIEVGRPSLTAREEVHARYPISEENAKSYSEGEAVELKVNKLTSSKTLYPVENYLLPFCQPEGGPKMDRQNLGQFLVGDRIESSPYRLNMKEDMYCEQLCISNLGRGEQKGVSPNKMVRAIRKQYHSNWIVDSIPAASKVEDDTTVTTRYWGGFPVGFIASDTRKAYVHNHVNIEIQYHSVETEPDKYRVVRMLVEPFSIKHEFDIGDLPARITNPIPSCNPEYHRQSHSELLRDQHTRYEMVYARGREPQPASGRVLFTYDVIWTENKGVSWASRWDMYLTMDYAIPDQVHWMSIANSLVGVMLLLAMIALTLVRNLRHLASYKRIKSDEEKAERIIGFGWQLLHRDVFRPPTSSPLLLAACCGTGVQLLCTAVETALLPVLGCIHPSNHGMLIVAMLVLFAINGLVAGYVSARSYCLFCRRPQEKGLRDVTKCTAFGFPGIAFGYWLLVNLLALVVQSSTYAVPMTSATIVLCLWLGILAPLTFLGAHIGYKQGALFHLPNARGPPPRKVPPQPLLRKLPFSIMAAGVLQFGCIFIEFYFIHDSLLIGQYCPFFGFQLIVLAILIVTAALTSSILNYYILSGGSEYRWWWRSFGVGGSGGIVLFVYACMHVGRGSLSLSFPTHLLYLGFMGLMALALFLMTGVVGLVSSFRFTKMLYAQIIASTQTSEEEDNSWIDALGEKIEAGSSSDRTANKKWLLCVGLVVLFLPALFYPHEIRAESQAGQRSSDVASDGSLQAQGDRIVGEAESVGDKIHRTESPHQFGISSSNLLADHGELAMAVVALLWVAAIICTIILKRRSARPGGILYLYNQRRVREIMAQKRRHLREMLKDPVTCKEMEARFGDLSSLRLIAESRWAPDKKEEGVKLWKKILLVPWIRNANALLFLIASTTFFGAYGEALSLMLLALVFVHLMDNLLLYRNAIAKGAPKIAETEGLFAAVGVPVIEVV